MFDDVRIVMLRGDTLSNCPFGDPYAVRFTTTSRSCSSRRSRRGILEKDPCHAANLPKMVTREALLALNGVHPKVMQELVGHYSPQITMDIYTHVNMDAKREAVAAVSKAFA